MSRATELTEQLNAFGPRPGGRDAERRAATWAARQIGADPRRQAHVETFWCRPNWAGAQAWHVTLAFAASLVATTQAKLGGALLLVALGAILLDWFTGHSPGRLLTRERASQNVVSISPRPQRVRLILTAPLDSGRLAPDNDRAIPGWLFWICLLCAWALILALVRDEGGRSVLVAVLQLIPTVALIGALIWLVDGRHPADDAPGVGAALALTRLLDAAPPANLGVDLVLTGVGSGHGLGLRRYLRAQRHRLGVTNTVVLGIGAGAGGYYLLSDGPLLPVGFFAELRRLAAATGLLTPRSARGCSPALPARLRGLPAITIGGDPDRVVEAGLALVDAVDAYVGGLALVDAVDADVGGLVPQTSQNRQTRWFRRG